MVHRPFPWLALLTGAWLLTPLNAAADQRDVLCEASRHGENYCRARTQGRAELVDQRSSSPCVEGRTWGYDEGGVWVSDGCRGVFRVGRNRHWDGNGRWDDDRNSGRWDDDRRGGRVVSCESAGGRYQYCSVRTEGRVDMVRQNSSAPCIEGRTWGYDKRGIWVDDGCRADFVVGR